MVNYHHSFQSAPSAVSHLGPGLERSLTTWLRQEQVILPSLVGHWIAWNQWKTPKWVLEIIVPVWNKKLLYIVNMNKPCIYIISWFFIMETSPFLKPKVPSFHGGIYPFHRAKTSPPAQFWRLNCPQLTRRHPANVKRCPRCSRPLAFGKSWLVQPTQWVYWLSVHRNPEWRRNQPKWWEQLSSIGKYWNACSCNQSSRSDWTSHPT